MLCLVLALTAVAQDNEAIPPGQLGVVVEVRADGNDVAADVQGSIEDVSDATSQLLAKYRTTLKQIDAIDRSQLSRPAMLDVFRVNALRGLNRHQEALDLMLATLEAAPWITLAYKDLGDIYYSRFDTARAWTAWDLGRTIAPGHGDWAQVNAYEERLRETFADLL